MTQRELYDAWEDLRTLRFEPEGPLWIDTRPIDYALELTATERLDRLECRMQIEELSQLADLKTLRSAIDLLRDSAAKNPHWNRGKPQEVWVGDEAFAEAKRKSLERP